MTDHAEKARDALAAASETGQAVAALVGIGHALLALAEAAPPIPPGPCASEGTPLTFLGLTYPTPRCSLLSGHAGAHTDGRDTWVPAPDSTPQED